MGFSKTKSTGIPANFGKLLKDRFKVDTETGLITYARELPRWGKAVGDVSGRVKGGYLCSRVGYDHYYHHLIVWYVVHKEWPTFELHHINGDKLDNRISNLEPISHSRNIFLARASNPNVGLRYYPKQNKWAARIKVNYRSHYLGFFDTVEEAREARAKASSRYLSQAA